MLTVFPWKLKSVYLFILPERKPNLSRRPQSSRFISVVFRVKFTNQEEEEDEEQDGGLVVELEGKDEKMERQADLWFSKVCVWLVTQHLKLRYSSAAPVRCVMWHLLPTWFLIFHRALCTRRASSLRLASKETQRASSNRLSGSGLNSQVWSVSPPRVHVFTLTRSHTCYFSQL